PQDRELRRVTLLGLMVGPNTCCAISQPPLRSSATYACLLPGGSRNGPLKVPPVEQKPGARHEIATASASPLTFRPTRPGRTWNGPQVPPFSSATHTSWRELSGAR